MNSVRRTIFLVLASAVALAAAGAWYHAHQALNELQAGPFVEKDNGILESYFVRIRRDGVARAAPMKQRLDALAENNAALVTLISAYLPVARTPAFATEADKFRHYAIAWRDRWNSVMELFMAGRNYPAAGTAMPAGFAGAVQTEIEASR